MDIICPICQKIMKPRALHFHIRNKHPTEYQEQGWRKLKAQSKRVPRKTPETQETSKGGSSEESGKEFEAWTEETQKKLGFFPSAASLAIINRFTTSTDPSKFLNEAVKNEGKRRGVSAALIKTEGGDSMELFGEENTDKEFNQLMKLIAANNQVQSSYNQYSPMFQMIQAMKDKVNNGMNMGQFGKEIMQMVMMIKMMEGM